jgi:hypothetical protein
VALSCRVCGAPLDPEGLDRDRGLARCRHCDALTEIDFSGPRPARPPRGARPRPEIPMPARYTLERGASGIRITWRWRGPRAMLVFVALGGWALYGAYAWLGTLVGLGPADGGGLVQPLVHGLVGLALLYAVALVLVQRSRIEAHRGGLRLVHAPLPWPGGGTVEHIQQLYSKRTTVQHGENTMPRYELWVIHRDGRQRKLLGGLDRAEQALWLEQALEAQLAIEDRPIHGELPRH